MRQEDTFRSSIAKACEEGRHLLVVRLDFKGGTAIGHSAVERDDAVYGFGLVCICGYAIWFHCPGLPMPVYVDAVSNVLDSDSSVSCLTLKLTIQKLLPEKETKRAVGNVETLMLWYDCGQHFRSRMFAQCALWELFGSLRKVSLIGLIFFC